MGKKNTQFSWVLRKRAVHLEQKPLRREEKIIRKLTALLAVFLPTQWKELKGLVKESGLQLPVGNRG